VRKRIVALGALLAWRIALQAVVEALRGER
jgi:hypothetical protein